MHWISVNKPPETTRKSLRYSKSLTGTSHGISDHQQLGCLCNMFNLTSKKISITYITGILWGEPPVTGAFPSKKGLVMHEVFPSHDAIIQWKFFITNKKIHFLYKHEPLISFIWCIKLFHLESKPISGNEIHWLWDDPPTPAQTWVVC